MPHHDHAIHCPWITRYITFVPIARLPNLVLGSADSRLWSRVSISHASEPSAVRLFLSASYRIDEEEVADLQVT